MFVLHNNRLLMLHRSPENPLDGGKWSVISGKVEGDESFEECALRELCEETGVGPNNLALFGFINEGNAVFVSRVTDEEAQNIALQREGTELRFVNFAELNELDLAEIFANHLREHSEGFRNLIEEDELPSPTELGLVVPEEEKEHTVEGNRLI